MPYNPASFSDGPTQSTQDPSNPWGYLQPNQGAQGYGANPSLFNGAPNPYGISTNIAYDNGQDLSITSPGSINPSQTNPYAAGYLQNNQNLYSQFSQSAAGGAFNPSFYQGMQNTSQANLTTSLGNQYARMGLSGSSAEMGGMSNAIQQNQMSWLNREQSDQTRAMQGLEGLNNQGYSETMGLQNQYSGYQNEVNQDQLGLYGVQQQQQAANNSLLGGIASAGIGAAGFLLGGPAGGMFGAQMGSSFGGGGSVGSFMGSDNSAGLTMPEMSY